MPNPFYTIGHSRRPVSDFIALLRSADVTQVIDVRAIPHSRANPQFDRNALARSLAQCAIAYEHIAALGGRRGRQRDVALSVNAFWQNESFHNYADYAMGAAFHAGFARLCDLGRLRHCAIMCAEALWWRCHRRIVPIICFRSARPCTTFSARPRSRPHI